MQTLYQLLIAGKQKAFIAAILTAVTVQLAQHGISIDMTLGDALQLSLSTALAYFGVYSTKNKK